MHQASNPVKTRPSRLTSSGNWVLPPKHSFSSSAQTIKVAFSDFTSLFLHTSVSYFTHSFFESLTCIQPALSLTSSPPQLYFFFKAHTSFPLNRLQVHLVRPPVFLLLRYRIPSQLRQDVALHLFALRDETVVGQRCQISDYEHLEDVNVINANQIPLTAIGRSSGLGRERQAGEKWRKKKERERHRGDEGGKGLLVSVLEMEGMIFFFSFTDGFSV